MTLHIGFLVFPGVQQLDLTGPHDVFASVSGTQVHLINKTLEPVKSSSGLWLTPSITYADCPQLDVICVPGGIGVGELMEDELALDFIKRQAANARFVTSVCTGRTGSRRSRIAAAGAVQPRTGRFIICSISSARFLSRRAWCRTGT